MLSATRWRGVPAAAGLGLLLLQSAACSSRNPASPAAPVVATATATVAGSASASLPAASSVLPSAAPSAVAAASTASCIDAGPSQHQAPELEATLPASVAGRPLFRWSVRGRCWLALAYEGTPVDPEALLREADAIDPGHTLDVDGLAFAVAGRMHTQTDPPYFVWAAARSRFDEEIAVTTALLFGGGGFRQPLVAADLSVYTPKTIGGKQVYVGAATMLEQTEHVRGTPYLYQTDDVMFLIVTEDPAWAEDAIRQLPG